MSEEQHTQPVATTSTPTQEGPEFHYHHEAEKTELEKWIRSGAKKIEPYSNLILMGVIGLAVVAAIAIYWARSTGATEKAAWQQFVNTDTPAKFEELASNYPNSQVATWALLEAGRGYLNEGLSTSMTDRESSDKSLTKAKQAFSEVLNHPKANNDAKSDAIYGLATTLEVLSGDDLSQAIEQYQRLVKDFPESQHVSWAKTRIEQLQQKSAVEFYAWFRKQNPNPEDRPLPGDLSNPSSPLINPELDLLEPDSETVTEEVIQPLGEGPVNTNPVPEEAEAEVPPTSNGQPLSAPDFPQTQETAEEVKDPAGEEVQPEAPELPGNIEESDSAAEDAPSSE